MKWKGIDLEGKTVVALVGNVRAASVEGHVLETGKSYKLGIGRDMTETDAGILLSEGKVALDIDDESMKKKIANAKALAKKETAKAAEKTPAK